MKGMVFFIFFMVYLYYENDLIIHPCDVIVIVIEEVLDGNCSVYRIL